MKFVKMRVLTSELQRALPRQAFDNVPPAKITEYYKSNPEAYQQFSLDRLFIPAALSRWRSKTSNPGKSRRS